MPERDILAVEREAAVAVIRLQRPDKHNAFNRALDAALAGALAELDADPDLHVAVLTGSGSAFSAGADMGEAVGAIDGKGRSEGMFATYAAAASFRKPLIAAVNGICYGGGALLATLCDLRLASENAAFRFPGAVYGLVVGGAQLPRIVGPAVAKDLLFTGRVVRAEEAARIGLVNAVLAPEELEPAALELARTIAGNSLPALIATKETVDRATQVDAGLEREAAWNRELRTSPEHHERFRRAAERVGARATDPRPDGSR